MKKLIHSVFLKRAHIMDFYALMDLVLASLNDVDLEQLHLKKEADDFKTVFLDFKKSLKKYEAKSITKKIHQADDTRDSIIRGLNLLLRGWILLPDKSFSEPAQQLKIIMEEYSNAIIRLPDREKSGVIDTLLKSFKKEDAPLLIQQLNLEVVVEQLAEANEMFEKLYIERAIKESAVKVGLSQQKRKIMQLQFEQLCNVIEANAIIYGAEHYQLLANRINVEVAKIKQD